MQARKWARRTFVVDRTFQFKYTALLVVSGVAVSVLFGVMMFVMQRDAQRLLMAAVSPEPEMVAELQAGERTLVWSICATTTLLGTLLAFLGILITHRLAGPLYVMGMYIQQIREGRYPQVRPLRKSDEFRPLFERFQGAVEALRQRETEDAEKIEQILRSLGERESASLEILKALLERKRSALAAAQPPPAVPAKA
jgi:hypothetical protein